MLTIKHAIYINNFFFQRLTMHPCLPEPPTKEIESEITESPASNTRRPADKNLGPMLPITKEILGDFYRPFNIKLAKVLRNDSFIWDNGSKLHKPPHPPFLSSTENHWCLSQWVSSLTSAHENQWFFIYFLIYKCRNESTVQNSTTERVCVWVNENVKCWKYVFF